MLDRVDCYADCADPDWQEPKDQFRWVIRSYKFRRDLFFEMMELYDGQAKEKFREYGLDEFLV